MPHLPESPDGNIDRKHVGDNHHVDDYHHVVYLVKRPAYTFALAVPSALPPGLGAALASFRMRPRGMCQTGDIALGLSELADLCIDLHQLLEYMLQERARSGGRLRPHGPKGRIRGAPPRGDGSAA
jgi:hypothetical protein